MLNEENFDAYFANKHAHELFVDLKSVVYNWAILNANDERVKAYSASIIISALAHNLRHALKVAKWAGKTNTEIKEILVNICDDIMQEIGKDENKND